MRRPRSRVVELVCSVGAAASEEDERLAKLRARAAASDADSKGTQRARGLVRAWGVVGI
ncbi:hypothetical protein LBMAG48_26710 [Phycisphaerae bacterium]|nr:hypothetical protein LBMAG48_26710 [Phycisphaerae bacterium]